MLLALASALLLGTAKFGLSIYRERLSIWIVILISGCFALLGYLGVGLATGNLLLEQGDLGIGMLGGTLNLAGTSLLLRAYRRGAVGIATAITASHVVIPVLASVLGGSPFTALTTAGVACIAIGLVIFYGQAMGANADAEHPHRRSQRAIGLALATALFWGLAIVVLNTGARVSVSGTLLVAEVTQVVLALLIVRAQALWPQLHSGRRAIGVLAGTGVALALGNSCLYLAADHVSIGVAAILSSLSPLVTALLAALVFQERLNRPERLALVIVVAGASLMAS